MQTPSTIVIAAACLLSVCFPCATAPAAENETPAGNEPVVADDPVLAEVGNQAIRKSDVARLAAQVSGPGVAQPTRKDMIEELINREVIRQYILSSDVPVDPADVEAKWNALKAQIAEQIGDGASVDDFLAERRLTEADVKAMLFIQVGLEQLAEARLTGEERASLDEEVRASHILVKTGPDVTDEQAKEKILAIRKEIEDGRPFEECARLYSDCRSKASGGDLGLIPRYGAMVEPFAAAAYALKKGELSQPVQTVYGWHLIVVTDRVKTTVEQKAWAKRLLLATKRPAILDDAKAIVPVKRLYKENEDEGEAPAEAEGEQPDTPSEDGAN